MLDIKLKRQLVDALLNCPSISDQETRKYLIKDMPDDIKDTIDRHSNNRVDIANIVNRCLDFSTGIEELINIVRTFEGDSEPMRKVYDAIPSILCLESPISNRYLSDLLFIFDKVSVQSNNLQSYYRASLPIKFKNQYKPQSIWQMITHLSSIPIQAGNTQPLVHFVQAIADHLSSGKEYEQLSNWICQLSTDFGLTSKKVIAQSDTCDHEIYSSPIYVLVHMIPDPNNRNNERHEFAVKIYRWRNSDDVPCVYTKKDCDKNNILNIIDDAIASEFDEDDDIRAIEFILPCELLNLDVDEWKREDKFEWDSGLINDYQVVVRLDRYHYNGIKLKRHFRDRWKEQWNRFKTMNDNDCAISSVFWVCNHENYDARKLCSEYRDDGEKTCLMQTFLPQHHVDFGLAILNAGIPVAVWCKKYGHHKDDHEVIKNDLLKLIKDGDLTVLPDRIHKICRKPDQKKRLQDHLTLLWDNPGRLPKDL